jgi:hypothetical protein
MGNKPLHSVSKFYFLEYFYVLLKSIEKYADEEEIFNSFKTLKQEHRLGESKYKTLTSDNENLTKAQIGRYRYTFEQVLGEAKEYNLVSGGGHDNLQLTKEGVELLSRYQEQGSDSFNQALLGLMENAYNAFKYLIEFSFGVNKRSPGLLIFPNYSPRQLHFERSAIKTTGDFVKYSESLVIKLQQDIEKYLGEKRNLSDENKTLLLRLHDSGLLPADSGADFDPKKYDVITKRFRDFWITYFLRQIYKYEYSMSSFDIWTYRGKQIGIIYATEFYPGFNGRIVYPTSVVMRYTESSDFSRLYTYQDGTSLYIHRPQGDENQNRFVDYLVKAYFDLKRSYRTYFISLTALREMVCYHMKISDQFFADLLDKVYKLNLAGQLKIKISLEVDRLPEETKAMYLKQEPVMVDGKYRNIIAIDIANGERTI